MLGREIQESWVEGYRLWWQDKPGGSVWKPFGKFEHIAPASYECPPKVWLVLVLMQPWPSLRIPKKHFGNTDNQVGVGGSTLGF